MKFIPSSQVDLENSLRVTSENSPRQILRIGLDRYVVLNYDQARLITAFESVKFSALINTLRCAVNDVEILATRYLYSARPIDPTVTGFEIRMYLTNGEGLAFNSDEESYAFNSPTAKSILDENRKAVHEHWELPEGHPFDRILVSDDFYEWVESLAVTDDALHILEHFWYDYQSIRDDATVVSPGKPLIIRGKLGDFYATEYLCGRVSFHCPD